MISRKFGPSSAVAQHPEDPERTPSPPAPPEPRPQATNGESKSGLAFRAGDYLRFKIKMERALRVALSEEFIESSEQRSTDIDLKLRGIFHLKVYEESDSHFTMGFELSGLEGSMRSSQGGELMNSQEIAAGMHGELFAKVHRLGRIETLSFPESTTAMGRNYWRSLLALWQFVLAEDDSLEEWEVTEEDPTGKYIAVYSKKQHGDRMEITKEKQAYESVIGKGDDVVDFADSTAAGGEALIVLDPLPLSVRGEEWMQVSPQGLPQTFSSEVTYSFERLEHVHDKELVRVVQPDQGYLKASRIGDAEALNAAPVTEVMTEEDIDEYLTDLHGEVAKIGLHSGGIATLLSRLVDLMKQDPRIVAEVMERLRQGDLSDDTAALYLSALGTAGTVEAQEGLREIFTGEEWSEDRRMSAMLAFVDVENPGAEVDGDLASLYEDTSERSSTALLLLAAVADRVKESDPQRNREIEAYVEDQLLDQSLTRAERMTALEALGNLRSTETSPLVEEALQSDDEYIRRAAVHALRRTLDDTAEGIVADALREDSSDVVRIAAVDVLLESERASSNKLLGEALRGNESEEVRKKILNGLGERSTPEARDAIAWTRENDTSEDVRRVAEEILRAQGDNEQLMAEPRAVDETGA